MTRWCLLLAVAAVAACAAAPADEAATSDPSALSAGTGTPADYAQWAAVLAAQDITPSTTIATVIGVRSANTRVAQVFDDMVVVLTPDQHATSFHASTHPWFQRNAAAPDVNGDGVGDVGMLKPGAYHAKLDGTTYGAPKFAVARPDGNGSLPGWRNTNGDDHYSADEMAASDARGDLLTDIRVHAAGPGSIAPIGCQVLAPADMNALSKLVGAQFDYVLVDAE